MSEEITPSKGKIKKQKSDKRILYYEAIRILAAFFVIYNHDSAFSEYLSGNLGSSRLLYIFVSVFAKCNVPLFFMISGALLLGKEESVKKLYMHRILKFTVVIAAASLALYLKYNIHTAYSIKEFFEKMISGDISPNYWFLYSYLGMLIMLPFLRYISKNMTKDIFAYLCIIYITVNSLIPVAKYVMAKNSINFVLSGSFSIPVITGVNIFFPLIGYWLDNKIDIKTISRKNLCMLAGGTLLGIIITEAIMITEGESAGYSQTYIGLFNYLIAILVFVLIKKLFINRNSNAVWARLIKCLGACTFGIYLMEPFFKSEIEKYIMDRIPVSMPVMLESVIYCLIAIVLIGAITFLLKKLPVIKELL